MTVELLDAYLDASGKESSVKDKLITVNGCLSTPAKWQEFGDEWQATLKGFGFLPDPKTGRYVFHATDFHSGYCKLSPKGLSRIRMQEIYHELIRIIRKHSLFIAGFAVDLKDYEKFGNDYPFIRKICLGKAGTFVSILAFGKSMEWASKNGYSNSISLMFDRGDEFWGQIYEGFNEYIKIPEYENHRPDSLTCGDKAVYSPIQAADVVAWECRKYFKRLANIKVNVAGITHHRELEMLRFPYSFYSFYQYDDIKNRVLEIYPDMTGGITSVERYLKHISETRDEKLRQKVERRRLRREEKQNEKES